MPALLDSIPEPTNSRTKQTVIRRLKFLDRKQTEEVLKHTRDRVMRGRARAVRTNKGEAGEEIEAKSRVVVPGHNDQDLGAFRSDSPTAPQLSLYLLMVIAAAKKWPLQAFDMETAFLNRGWP